MAITSLNGLLKRTQEFAREQTNVLFDELPHAFDLGMGWYPGRMLMQQETEGRLRDCLPDITGIVIPYFREPGVLNHLVIAEVSVDRRLNRRKRSVLCLNRGAGKGRVKGIFGIGRIVEGHKTIQVCQSELTAARLRNAIAMTGPDRDLAKLLAENAAKVNLVGETQEWYDEMLALAKAGIELTINGNEISEHYNDEIYKMVIDKVGTSAMANRLQEILKRLMPADAINLLAKLEASTKFDFSKLLPGDMRLFRNEKEFYALVRQELAPLFACGIEGDRLLVRRRSADCPLISPAFYNERPDAELLGHYLAIELGYMDMLAWAQERLKSIPHFYMYHKERLEPRYEVSKRIAQVALSVLIQDAVTSGRRR